MEELSLAEPERRYLYHLGKSWIAWAGIVSLLVTIVLLRWPTILSDQGVPWWGFFWIGALLVFWAQYRIWRQSQVEHARQVESLRADKDRISAAVYGDEIVLGPGLRRVREQFHQYQSFHRGVEKRTDPLSVGLWSFPARAPYGSTLTLLTTEDIAPRLEVRWSGPVFPRKDWDLIESEGRKWKVVAEVVDQRTIRYVFTSEPGHPALPANTEIPLGVYAPREDTRALLARVLPS